MVAFLGGLQRKLLSCTTASSNSWLVKQGNTHTYLKHPAEQKELKCITRREKEPSGIFETNWLPTHWALWTPLTPETQMPHDLISSHTNKKQGYKRYESLSFLLPLKDALKMKLMLATSQLRQIKDKKNGNQSMSLKNKQIIILRRHTVEGSESQKSSRQMLQASSQGSWIPPWTKAAADVKCPSSDDVVLPPAPYNWIFNTNKTFQQCNWVQFNKKPCIYNNKQNIRCLKSMA